MPIKLVGRLLPLALSAVFAAAMNNANAGPISSYDALDDFDLDITLTNGATFVSAALGSPVHTNTGDGMFSGSLTADGSSSPGVLEIDLEAFGSGTGSSEISGFASLDISGPATYEIDITVVTHTQTTSTIFTPPGTATASAAESFSIPGATPIFSGCPAGVTFCYDAGGTVTATLGGDVAGSAFTPTAPEPATLALLGIGLAGLGLSRRKC